MGCTGDENGHSLVGGGVFGSVFAIGSGVLLGFEGIHGDFDFFGGCCDVADRGIR